jgi:hypothetical protein
VGALFGDVDTDFATGVFRFSIGALSGECCETNHGKLWTLKGCFEYSILGISYKIQIEGSGETLKGILEAAVPIPAFTLSGMGS